MTSIEPVALNKTIYWQVAYIAPYVTAPSRRILFVTGSFMGFLLRIFNSFVLLEGWWQLIWEKRLLAIQQINKTSIIYLPQVKALKIPLYSGETRKTPVRPVSSGVVYDSTCVVGH